MFPSASETTFAKHVLESSEPVLVYFWAPWCKLCLIVQPALAQFQARDPGQLKIVSINADENFKIANTYRLKMLPTVLLFERGVVTHRIEGFHGREEMQRRLASVTTSLTQTVA